ncbi:Predicted arabinose efflux permease, MFS family [Evansella caseinilytica]|uniref:Predicted arabinose efflux permease, MFS family n=1 Tax=Evansella caseinilytica TaxID=1503961 RepID=A0A1H3L223_9BACI|nr:MFS transporter [Evansella caseinilytica]SDY58451.1 Predicted arabinose efflux permease, MFS family [Evansella caseinilytica]
MNSNNNRKVTTFDHFIFMLVTFLYWFSLYIYVPILSPYMEWLGASYTFIGIVLGSYGFMQVAIRFPLGVYSDKLQRRRPFIWLGMIISAISCFGYLITDLLGWALVFRALSGISAATWVAFTVLYASYFTKNEATKAMGVISFITVGGQLAGMVFSGIVTDIFGWLTPFFLGGIAAVIGFVLSFQIKETAGDGGGMPMKVKDLTAVVKEPSLLKVSFLSILAHSILFITMFGFTPNYAMNLGATATELSYLVMAFMVPHAIGAIVVSRRFSQRFGRWNTLLAGFFLSGACSLIIPFTPLFEWLLITQLFNGFGLGMILPMLLGMAIQTVSDEKRATAMGFYQAVYAIGMFAGPFLAGWLSSAGGLETGFYLAGIVGVISVFLIVIWMRTEQRAAEKGRRKELE